MTSKSEERILDKKAFTIIELVVVVAVLGILVLLGAPKFLGYTNQANLTHIMNDIEVYESAIQTDLISNSELTKAWPILNSSEVGELLSSKSIYNKKGEIVKELDGAINVVKESELEVKSYLGGSFILNRDNEVFYSKEELEGHIPEYGEDSEFIWVTANNMVTILGYKGNKVDLEIPSKIENNPVVSIGWGALSNKSLRSVKIPNTVVSIDGWAFAGNQLRELTIPDSVERIGILAFDNNRLTTLIIPDNVREIGGYAFHLNQLNTVIIGKGLSNMDGSAFAGLQNPTFMIDERNETFKHGDNYTGIYSKDGKTLISGKPNIFETNSYNEVLTIGDFAFKGNLLTHIPIPEGVTHIGNYALENNDLRSLKIPNSVIYIGESAFYTNHELEEVENCSQIGDVSSYFDAKDFNINNCSIN